ncbi:hypothetical protein HDU86_007542 [Geranomyces michiganensis]|nr:hypothetical protein HDU86_007542 [Geranomyces michiganensis]
MSYYDRVSRSAAAAAAAVAPHADLHDADEETATERRTMDSHLPEDNIGYQLLLKMGWKRGTGLGAAGEGRVEPVRIYVEDGGLGLGKREQLNTYLAETTANRKMLASEVIAAETEEERLEREARAKRSSTIKEEIKAVTAAFFCSDCNKQYSKVSEYETHLSSYDHNHVLRFKDMKEATRKGLLPGVPDKRKREDKERAREEKEMRRLQQAAAAMNGAGRGAAPSPPPPPPPPPRNAFKASSPPPPPPSAATTWSTQPTPPPPLTHGGGLEHLNRGGWDAISVESPAPHASSKGGWGAVSMEAFTPIIKPSGDAETDAHQVGQLPPLQQNANASAPKMSFGFGKKPVAGGGGMKFGFKKK